MSAPILTFFNNKGGVGKTSLVYHLSWIFSDMGKRVVVADLDPQANLTAAFLDEERIESLWEEPTPGSTIYDCVKPLTGVGDIVNPVLQKMAPDLFLIPGAVELSSFEDALSNEWPHIRQQEDPHCLAIIKHYRSLIPMAQEYRKPIFKLTSADGAIGSHANAVQDARRDFKSLGNKIFKRIGLLEAQTDYDHAAKA